MTNAPNRPANPFAGTLTQRRLTVSKLFTQYGISPLDGVNMLAKIGDITQVTDDAAYIEQVTQACIDKVAKNGGQHKSKPEIKSGRAVPNDSMMFQDAQKLHYVPDVRYWNLKGQVDQRVGKHADVATRKQAWLDICKENEEARPVVRDEFNMAEKKSEQQNGLFEDKATKPARWTTEQSDAYEKGVEDICIAANIPSNLLTKFTVDILGQRNDFITAGKQPGEQLALLELKAAQWAIDNVPASTTETPSPDLETTFNNLEQAANKVSEVVSQDAQVTVEKSPPAIETASASAVEPPIENEAPTSATEASNVIEGEIVEDKKPSPSPEEINRLRVDVDRLIISTWPDLNGKDKVEGRVAHIKAIYPDCEGMQAVYIKYGYDVAYKMAHVYCTEKILQPSASALVSVADQPMNITPITSAPSARNFKMPTPEEFQMMQTFASAVAKSGLYKEVNTFDKAFVILWKGFELGVGLGAALDGIYIINGRPWPGAQILKAVVMASGQAVRFDVTCDETQAIVTVQRKGMEIHQYKFTKEDAILAKLWDGGTWKNHPKRMMMHRATRLAIITDFPDLAAGIGIAIDGEDEDMVDNADVAEKKQIEAQAAAA